MRRVQLDKIASVTLRLGLNKNAVLGDEIPARAGTVVAARVLNAKTSYNTLEDVHGRMVTLHPGDVIAGALGHRDALYGYSGRVPEQVAVGDQLQLLNIGGVIGIGAEAVPGLGEPFKIEVLGSVLEFPYLGTRFGVPANIERAALPTVPLASDLPPIVALVGTCMDAGKTTAASVIIGELSRRGLTIGAGKLTGVSLRRDVLQMADCGADTTAIFTDFGVVTTHESTALAAAHSLVSHLAEAEPDVIVLEMGDGLLGTYGVHSLLSDPGLSGAITATVLCAQDPVGAWGGQRLLTERYGMTVAAISGRVTDSAVGMRFCTEKLGVAAWNALRDGHRLTEALLPHIERARRLPRQEVGA
ncbi:MAG: hypothetical protein IPK67_06890 [Planctomycetes bacterium]|jgi:hypothetical protein|nr:hypothetical protein [Planctomycetota bacterium]